MIIDSIEKALKKPTPGFEAQRKMLTRPRPGTRTVSKGENTGIEAGVLILLYFREDCVYLVLTLRTERVESHQGQISLPGGRKESGESLQQTALRETQEELGVNPKSLKVLGELTPLYIPPSTYCIYPTVAFASEQPDFLLEPREVAEVIEVPLEHLIDSKNVQEEKRTIRSVELIVPYFSFENHKIWGATAMVLSEFVEIVTPVFTEEIKIQ